MSIVILTAAFVLLAPPMSVATVADSVPLAATAPSPAEAQTVLVEGRAAVGSVETGGALAAKQTAVADALRNAVAKVAGVYVRSGSLTRNFQLVKDEILTRADGYATLSEIVRTERVGNVVRVVVRATVSTRPLAERLKALRLTRAFRVFVNTPENMDGSTLTAALTEAGFPVMDSKANADIIVSVVPRFVTVAKTPLKTAAGAMTYYSVRATVRLLVTRAETGESVASLQQSENGTYIAEETAQTEAANGAFNALSPPLLNALLTLPAQVSEPVEIVVTGVKDATQYAAIGEAITLGVPGVQKTTGRRFDAATKRAVYEADVLADANALVPRALETAPGLKRFGLRVKQAARARVVVVATAPQ
ncbi:MAG: hypothetical protein H7Y38_10770 [Armatimonadetes bacterium]|nr:hypothetical protein [Armatimonadota bacterium]